MSCLKAKMHQIQFSWGSVPHAAGGAYSTPQTPQLDLKGPTLGMLKPFIFRNR